MLQVKCPLTVFPVDSCFFCVRRNTNFIAIVLQINTVLSPLKSKLQMPFALEAGQYFHVHLLLLWAKLQYFINNCVRAVQVRHFFL